MWVIPTLPREEHMPDAHTPLEKQLRRQLRRYISAVSNTRKLRTGTLSAPMLSDALAYQMCVQRIKTPPLRAHAKTDHDKYLREVYSRLKKHIQETRVGLGFYRYDSTEAAHYLRTAKDALHRTRKDIPYERPL